MLKGVLGIGPLHQVVGGPKSGPATVNGNIYSTKKKERLIQIQHTQLESIIASSLHYIFTTAAAEEDKEGRKRKNKCV